MKKTESLPTGIEIKFNSDGNIKDLKSPLDDNEPTNFTIKELEFRNISIGQNRDLLKEVFMNFAQIYKK